MSQNTPSPDPDFLTELHSQAALQARLHSTRLLPPQLDWLTSFVGRHPWQVVVGASFMTAVILQLGVFV